MIRCTIDGSGGREDKVLDAVLWDELEIGAVSLFT